MPLTLPEALGFVPKVIGSIEKTIDSIKEINQLPTKNFKSVGGKLGIVEGSVLYGLLDITDDILAAARS